MIPIKVTDSRGKKILINADQVSFLREEGNKTAVYFVGDDIPFTVNEKFDAFHNRICAAL